MGKDPREDPCGLLISSLNHPNPKYMMYNCQNVKLLVSYVFDVLYLYLFAVTWFNNVYSAIVKVKLFVCIGEMISFRYGTRIPANLTQ